MNKKFYNMKKQIWSLLLVFILAIETGITPYEKVYAQALSSIDVLEQKNEIVENNTDSETEESVTEWEITESLDPEATVEREKSNVHNCYQGDGYLVDFNLDSIWDSGFNATITVTNTSNEKIENWSLIMPLDNSVSNIWNAIVEDSYDDFYLIKNAGWNQDISINGSVSFGVTSNEAFAGFPEYYTIVGKKFETKTEEYMVEYKICSVWEEGVIGQITITNTRDTVIEDWRLSFLYDGDITEIWDGKIIAHSDNMYEIVCEDYNQNIAVGESVSFGFKVKTSEEVTEPDNIKLSEYILNDYGKYIAIMGYYNDEIKNNDLLQIYVTCSEKCDKYVLYFSENGEDYKKVDQINDVDEFVYKLQKYNVYFYVKGYYGSMSIDSDVLEVQWKNNQYYIINSDMDKDKLCDYLEYTIGSNPNNIDSDGDGLDDYYEVYFTCSSPIEVDSDKNGINDGEEDLDGDGLTNIEEFNGGTYPFDVDSDKDGLNDFEEKNEYHTNPLNEDSDGDTLLDGDEVQLSLNPLKQDTDENGILDPDEFINQHSEFEINETAKPLVSEVSVDIKCKGLLDKNIIFENMYNKDIQSSEVVGLLSAPIEIVVNTEFEEATISFTYEPEQLENIQEDNLAIIWYDRDNDDYVLLDSVIDKDKHTVSYKTNHFSMYLLVDKEVWFDCWREDINYRSSTGVKYYDIVFTVDVSGSMSGSRLSLAKQAMNTFVDALMDGDLAGIVTFNSYAQEKLAMTQALSFNKSLFTEVINSLKASGGTNANAGLRKSMEMLSKTSRNEKFIILICDGDVSVDKNVIAMALENNVAINCVNVASGSAQAMQDIAYATGGTYYYAATTADLLKKIGEIQKDTVDSIDLSDTDGDGLYDVYEVNGMKLSNGQVIYTDANSVDSDGDGISDYDELGGVSSNKQIYIDGDLYSCTVFHDKSKPEKKDSDNDGIPDVVDDNPLVVDIIEVASLGNNDFLEVYNPSGIKQYGGNQGWWEATNSTISGYGCGLIAMCNTELYLTMNNSKCTANKGAVNNLGGVIENDYYVKYAEDRAKTGGKYEITDLLGEQYDGLFPEKMKSGLKSFYKDNGLNYNTYWAASISALITGKYIMENINNNIPVVASYDNTLSRTTYENNNDENLLPYYEDCDKSKKAVGGMTSHYFVITGAYKKYNGLTYDLYYSISNYGQKRYIYSDAYLRNLNYFTNILYTNIK